MKDSENQVCRVPVVDDEPTVGRAIKMLLQFDGHEVQTVDSGEAALALLEQRQFDVVITDFSLLGMKGDQLAARIKQRWPDQPIIMATAYAEVFSTFGKAHGDVDFLLQKPFSQVELREAIISVLTRKNPNSNSGLNIASGQPPPVNFIPPPNPQP